MHKSHQEKGLKLELDSVIEPLPSSSPTLVEKEPLSVCNESTLPSSVVTLVENDALDSVIEPLPSSNPTLVENEPLSV
jgi:hypothetical protein